MIRRINITRHAYERHKERSFTKGTPWKSIINTVIKNDWYEAKDDADTFFVEWGNSSIVIIKVEMIHIDVITVLETPNRFRYIQKRTKHKIGDEYKKFLLSV